MYPLAIIDAWTLKKFWLVIFSIEWKGLLELLSRLGEPWHVYLFEPICAAFILDKAVYAGSFCLFMYLIYVNLKVLPVGSMSMSSCIFFFASSVLPQIIVSPQGTLVNVYGFTVYPPCTVNNFYN